MKRRPIRNPQPQPRQRPSEHALLEPSADPAPFTPARWSTLTIPAWVVLPLRLFLGVTFAYAGVQKLTDPHYFHPGTPGYIGRQIQGFATGTPLRGVLLHLVLPHATLFGGLIAWGELAIGLGVLIGLLVRPAAFCGALLSLIFFLSASWRIYPYFYGSDIVFLFGWTVILLAGPLAGGGWPVFDARLASWVLAHVPEGSTEVVTSVLQIGLGTPNPPASVEGRMPVVTAGQRRGQPMGRSMQVRGGRGASSYVRAQNRREFLRGMVGGALGTLGLVFLFSLLHSGDSSTGSSSTGSGLAPNSGSTGAAGNTPGAGGTATIAEVSQVPTNNSVSFSVPSTGDPGVLVHLSSGDFVAFDALCTHASCTVQYDPGSQLLLCPCHGAAFDPAHGASVVQGPAPTPLTSIPVKVNQATGAITASS
jgi:thiosulfate dehydrogenase (quinone) large subunit